jgi:hypothetical protein
METKDKGNVTIEKGKKKPVKCHKFTCRPINRELMVHEDIDNKNYISVSDYKTGYRLFGLPQKISSVKNSDIIEELKKFIKHYTKEGIAKEFERIENIQSQAKKD